MEIGTGAVIAAGLTATGVVVAAVVNARAQLAVAKLTSAAAAATAAATSAGSAGTPAGDAEKVSAKMGHGMLRTGLVLSLVPVVSSILIGVSTFSQSRLVASLIIFAGSCVTVLSTFLAMLLDMAIRNAHQQLLLMDLSLLTNRALTAELRILDHVFLGNRAPVSPGEEVGLDAVQPPELSESTAEVDRATGVQPVNDEIGRR